MSNIKNNPFLQGYICAICDLLRMEREVTTQIKELFDGGVGNKSQYYLRMAGIDYSDILILKKHWKQLHPSKNLKNDKKRT